MWNVGQSLLGGDDDERGDDFFDHQDADSLCPNLSPTQRIYGFAASLIAGLLFIFLSLIVIIKPIKFALLFTFGNVLAVGSGIVACVFSNLIFQHLGDGLMGDGLMGFLRAFLIGPAEQLRKMFDPVRVYATAVYLGCVVLALICAILIHSKILTLFAMLCEICALVWYSLSYIPFARRLVSDMMVRLFDTEI